MQTPALQTSLVQEFVSAVQAVPLALAGCVHVPLEQTSLVQTLPSSGQDEPFATAEFVQVPLLLQTSLVHGLLSLQSALDEQPEVVGVPRHTPLVHWSLVVPELPSLHTQPFGVLG